MLCRSFIFERIILAHLKNEKLLISPQFLEAFNFLTLFRTHRHAAGCEKEIVGYHNKQKKKGGEEKFLCSRQQYNMTENARKAVKFSLLFCSSFSYCF